MNPYQVNITPLASCFTNPQRSRHLVFHRFG